MGAMAMDPDGAQRGSKGWCVKHVGQLNELSTDTADHGATAKTRNWDIVGQDYKATRSRGVLHK